MLRHLRLPVRWRSYGKHEPPFPEALHAVLFGLSWLPGNRFDRRQTQTRARRVPETVAP